MAHRQTSTGSSTKEIIATRPDLAVDLPITVVAANATRGNLDTGTVMGKITSGGKYRRYTRAAVKTGGDFATNAATGAVVDADLIFKAGDVLTRLDGTTGIGTVASVSGDTITLTGNASNTLAAGVDLLASDGSQVAAGVLRQVVDVTELDRMASLIVSGFLTEANLVGLNAAAKTALGMTSMVNGVVKF